MSRNDQPRAVVFCPGPMGVFEQATALAERGHLGTVALDHYFDLRRLPYSRLNQGRAGAYLRKRHHPGLPADRVRSRHSTAVAEKLAVRFARTATQRNQIVYWHNRVFDRWVANHLPAFGNLAVGYESSSLLTFRRARELGMPTALYQPIACAEVATALLDEEARRWPHLADTLRYNYFPEPELARRREERVLADMILCASSFTKRSLVAVGVPEAKIRVEPYGVDQSIFLPSHDKHARFSVIWASSFTQTKGIAYLLEALARQPVPGLELVLAGYPFGADPVLPYEHRITVRRLGKVDRPTLAREMARCHVHVFPTLVEGFGRNIIEAMAAGLPVVTTPNAAGPDLIDDGRTGFIVPIRDSDAIADRLAWIADHPADATAMGEAARLSVAHLTPADYRRRFADRIEELWNSYHP